MNSRPKAYIAGPISNGATATREVMADNMLKGIVFANRMWDLGYVPFCPQLSVAWHNVCPRDYNDWIEYDKSWLECCDVLIRMPGESKGADLEVAYAKELGLPILTTEEEIKEYMDDHLMWENGIPCPVCGGDH